MKSLFSNPLLWLGALAAGAFYYFEYDKKTAAAAGSDPTVPSGANVTYADGTEVTLTADTPLSSLAASGATSYAYQGAVFGVDGGPATDPNNPHVDPSYIGDV